MTPVLRVQEFPKWNYEKYNIKYLVVFLVFFLAWFKSNALSLLENGVWWGDILVLKGGRICVLYKTNEL